MTPPPKLFIVGALLLVSSVPPLFLAAREVVIRRAVESRYRVQEPERPVPDAGFAQETRIGRTRIQLADDAPQEWKRNEPFEGPVRIFVNGRPYGTDEIVRIRPEAHDANRYWGSLNIMKVADSHTGDEHIVIGQRLPNGTFRLMWVTADASVTTEVFSYRERCSPPIRARLIRYVVPSPSGYCSDIMSSYPSLLFPLLYPWLSGFAGTLFTIAGSVIWWQRRRQSRTPDPIVEP